MSFYLILDFFVAVIFADAAFALLLTSGFRYLFRAIWDKGLLIRTLAIFLGSAFTGLLWNIFKRYLELNFFGEETHLRAEELGLKSDVKTILERAASGEIKMLYIFEHNFQSPEAQKMLEQTEYVIFQGTHWNKTGEYSNVVLPGVTYAEKDGTFTNFEGRLQRFQQALLPLSDSKADIEILRTLAQKLEYPMNYLDAEEIFKEWRGRAFQELEEFGELLNGQ